MALQLFTPEPHRADPLLRAGDAVHAPDRLHRRRGRGPGSRGSARWTRRSATASCMRRPFRSPIQTRATRSGRCTAGRWCWSPIRRPILRATSSRRASSTTRWARSSASAPRPVPAAPTSGPTASCGQALAGSPAALPPLPDGIDLSFSFRRATRARANEGLPIEDVGVSGTPYAMTRDDLLNGNRDLIATCIDVLEAAAVFAAHDVGRYCCADDPGDDDRVGSRGREVRRPFGSQRAVGASGTVTITYPPRTKTVELAGCSGPDTLQRRRLSIRP